MDRSELIQQLIDSRKFKTYMEIGVSGGRVFFNINCRRKIAVDPHFKFNWKGKLGECIRNTCNFNNRYFEISSDRFFSEHAAKLLSRSRVDVCLVDGMHEFEFALRDVLNTLQYLSEDGVIIMHDCNPRSAEAECSFEDWRKRGFTGAWNGDVWKVIVYLRSFMPEVTAFVADCDEGLGVILKTPNEYILRRYQTRDEIDTLTYQDLENDRIALLNMISAEGLEEFVKDPYQFGRRLPAYSLKN